MLSRSENLTPIVELVSQIRPRSVVDVGPGWGKLGLIVREHLTARDVEDGDFEVDPETVVRLTAWEPAAYFRQPMPAAILTAIYDEVIWKAATAAYHPRGFELVLLVDVLEHLPTDEGAELVRALIEHNRHVLVSTPSAVHMYDQPYYGEDFAQHQSQWHWPDLDRLGPIVWDRSTSVSHIALYGKAGQ